MIIYEVNLKIESKIEAEFRAWLVHHIEEMLTIEGYKNAHSYLVEQDDPNKQEICVQYFIESRESLENYFHSKAQVMRQDGLTRFPNQFTATRRIMKSL